MELPLRKREIMRKLLVPALALTLVGVSPLAVSGQDYRSSVGWTLGAHFTTSLNGGAAEGTALDLEPGVGAVGSLFVDHWFGAGIVGFRGQGTYAWNSISWVEGDRDVYSWSLGGLLLLRPFRPGPEPRAAYPYLGVGTGGMEYRLGEGPATAFDDAGALHAGEEEFGLVGIAALGVDVPLPWNWGEGPMLLRVEVSDHLRLDSPLEPTGPEPSEFDPVHVFGLSLGLHTGIGFIR